VMGAHRSAVLPYFVSGHSGTRPSRHALTLSQGVPAPNTGDHLC
jgi:hypothetical protein